MGALGIIGAGEAVAGAEAQATAMVNELASSGKLADNTVYQKVLAAYDGAEEKSKAFLAEKILKTSMTDVIKTGAIDGFAK